jgi:NAD(P)-binding Rossmann-like domain
MSLSTGLHVGVLGTGLPALAAAYFTQKSGHSVTVLDAEQGYVGVGKSFSYGGGRFDQFLQVVTDRDHEVLALRKELGFEDQLQWLSVQGRGILGWIQRKPKVATCGGLARAMELELRNRLDVEPVSRAMDLLEHDYSIEVRTDRGKRQFDAVITTLAIDEVDDMARGLISHEMPRSQGSRRTLVNVVFLCSSPLLEKLSTFVVKPSQPFQTVSSTTDVDSGLTAINVCGFSESADVELRVLALRLLCDVFHEFQPSNVDAVRVFRSSERTAVCSIAARIGEGRLFLASRELGFGLPVSMNTDLLLARQAVKSFLECAPIFACGERQAAHAAGR